MDYSLRISLPVASSRVRYAWLSASQCSFFPPVACRSGAGRRHTERCRSHQFAAGSADSAAQRIGGTDPHKIRLRMRQVAQHRRCLAPRISSALASALETATPDPPPLFCRSSRRTAQMPTSSIHTASGAAHRAAVCSSQNAFTPNTNSVRIMRWRISWEEVRSLLASEHSVDVDAVDHSKTGARASIRTLVENNLDVLDLRTRGDWWGGLCRSEA